MRYTVAGGTALAAIAGYLLVEQQRVQHCADVAALQVCMQSKDFATSNVAIAVCALLGLILSVLLTPVFLTQEDEDKRKLKWRYEALGKLESKRPTPEIQAEIAQLKAEIQDIHG